MKRWVTGLLGHAGNAKQGLMRLSLLALTVAMGVGSAGSYVQSPEPGGVNRYGLVVAGEGDGSGEETSGPSATVSAAPVTKSFTVTSGYHNDPPSSGSYYTYRGFSDGHSIGSINPATFTYEGATYTVTSAYEKVWYQYDYTTRRHTRSDLFLSRQITVSPGMPGRWIGGSLGDASDSTSWTCNWGATQCRGGGGSYRGTDSTTAGIQLHPPWSLTGSATGAFVTTDPSNITLRASVPLTNASYALPAATTWTISPTPEGITSPEHVTVIGSSSRSISKDFAGLSPNTAYTVTVRKQGTAASTAKSVDAIFAPPESITLGTPTGEFSGGGLSSHILTVTIPASVPDDDTATQVPLTWTISPTPTGASSPEHVIETIDESGNVVKVWSDLPPFTQYMITAKQYGAPDSEAKSLSAIKIPGHVPFHAPSILKVTDQTPDNNDTASLQVTWSGAPAIPVTGYWLRYNLGGPLTPDAGQETNIVRVLPPIARSVGTVDIEALAYYAEDTEVTYRGRDQTVPTGETWFSTWSETYSTNISRPSGPGSYVPAKEATPLVVETFEGVLPVMGIPAEHAPSYALLFLFFLTVGAGGFLYVGTGGGAMSATLGGMVAVIVWSGLGWWWFGLPVPMALVPVAIIILVGGTIVTTRVLA